ncbi:MAG: DNA primase [Desulfobacterales bacterium]|nr:DNA primase [Desulfobacteraceae bacterium]MBT4365722.1 DNA primase [Desulfobacteraceae bacterium]MBT7085287.1 DNA primase [Desulfobacterales bacterium]MBT7696169.1 DNA primase [Desulfobacterales bacterium]
MTNFIPEDKIAEIRNTADIIDVVSEVVLLKKAGKNHLGLCPFHSEKTPSFTVSSPKQMFYCFGCGTGGNVFSFLMKHEGISFPEASRILARKYGIDIPVQSQKQKEQTSEKEKIVAVNELAMNFFRFNLLKDPVGKRPVEYLKKRGIKRESVDALNMGYAPNGWDNLVKYLFKKGIPEEISEKSGLIVQRKKGGYYDRFRDRIIFPISDIGRRVIGFGGRVMDDSLPKYLNSPETPLYNKSRSLYGLHIAKQACRESGIAFIVEGYFDFLSLFQHGIKNSVATLGTALTPEHMRLLKGYASKVILVYDSDEAGIKAAQRSVDVLEKGYMDARILVLPEGYDPDSYLFEFGSEAFNKLAEGALGIVSFLIESAINKHGVSVEGKIRIVSDMEGYLAAVKDNVARSLYINQLAERIGIDEAAILEKVRTASRALQGNIENPGQRPVFARGPEKKNYSENKQQGNSLLKLNEMEKLIIAMMLRFPELLPDIKRRAVLSFFQNDDLKKIGQAIESKGYRFDDFNSVDPVIFAENKEQEILIASLSIENDLWAWDKDGCLKLIDQFLSSNNNQGADLTRKIRDACKKNDDELVSRLLEEKQQHLKMLKEKQSQVGK